MNLKPENLIMNKKNQLKIADFGTAYRDTCCDSPADDIGTYHWMAPEMIAHKTHSKKVDIDFVVTIWKMVPRSIPQKALKSFRSRKSLAYKFLKELY